jgi:hypothetical protein
MPVEQSIVAWLALPWQDEIGREDLLALRIRQSEQRTKDMEVAGFKNKKDFNKLHRLRPRKIVEGD